MIKLNKEELRIKRWAFASILIQYLLSVYFYMGALIFIVLEPIDPHLSFLYGAAGVINSYFSYRRYKEYHAKYRTGKQ